MGIIISIISAAAAGVAEAVADAAATVTALGAGAAADAVASGMELVGAVGEAAADTIPLLEGEEETVFDAGWVGEEGYTDEGVVNDPWNWEMTAAEGTGGARLARALGGVAAVGIGAGIATGIGLAAASKGEAGRAVLEASQSVENSLMAEGDPELTQTIPDAVLAFMTPEEYEWASEALRERQIHGHFTADTLQEAENAVVYSSPQGSLPYAEKDPSLLFDVARSSESSPWLLPGAGGQPLTRGMLQRMNAAREVIERGREVSQVFRLSAETRRELRRAGRALDEVYNAVVNRQPAGGPDPRDLARRVADQALQIGVDQGQQLLANVLGGGAIASTLASTLVAGGLQIFDRFIGPSLPREAVQIENSKYEDAPYLVSSGGQLWRKGRSSYIVEEGGHLGTVNLSYYTPETTKRGLPSNEPWFHFAPRTEDQLHNLEFWLRNNWGGTHTYLGLSVEGNFIVGDLVLQEAAFVRKRKGRSHARPKRRARDPGPRPRAKRARRARN